MPPAKPAKAYSLLLQEREVPLKIQKMRHARYISIQWRPLKGDVLLTLPAYTSLREGLSFAATRKHWLEECIKEHGEPRKLTPGMRLNLLGQAYELRHAPEMRGVVEQSEKTVTVYGGAAFFSRRLNDWLRGRARTEIEALAYGYAARIGKRIQRINVRDTTSRWGSCSESAALSFSWRLIFAPREVLDYVVAHEVAHLKEMNHSPRFWRIVAELAPHHEAARRWLNRNGHTLYAFA
jgi:hypothetical protein